MKKIINIVFAIIIILVWLMPVSNQYNTLNDNMMRNCYLLSLGVIVCAYLYESKYDKKQLLISFLIILILIIATEITLIFNKDSATISYGYLMNYIPFCVLINFKAEKLCKGKILDSLFVGVCILIITTGILTVLNNSFVEQLLKTNYIIHYPHIYTVMWNSHKTVTFFATHSIACYIYFILWWLLDYRRHIKKGILNYVLMLGIFFNIIMCQSVSAVLCIGIIFGYYYLSWIKRANKNTIFRSIILLVIFLIIILANSNSIIKILSSSENGILGRYGSTGNLNSTINFAIKNVIPIGLCDIDGLWLTDGGYFIHFVRGGILMLYLFYLGLYRFLKINIKDTKRAKLLFIALLLFEVGYQFTICMRFFLIMLFAVIYFSYLYNEKEKLVLKK